MQQHYLQFPWFGQHYTVGYRAYGDAANPNVLLCVHGISRNARDFDTIGEALADRYYVIAVDMPGRGRSDWMDDKIHYGYPLYETVAGEIIAMAGVPHVDWIGTSMGGVIGMRVAAMANSPIRRLVLNDIGPFIPAAGRRQNGQSFGLDTRFASEAEGVRWVRANRTAFGPFTDAQWEKFGRDSLRQISDTEWGLDYDPGLAETRSMDDHSAWDQWERIACPVLCVWGLDSVLLTPETVARMRTTGPKAQIHEVPGVGHCPGLVDQPQIQAIRRFLTA
ncbi:MAG: alpha/beta hydrolase [Alphaproteobacteria bacterium]|nr:alpha/beta hydrolase [Alphaproteobacteria bacterium]MCB9929569.1 alpha/beta hydrolase [Alphaproteobacteria bacterium]